MDRAQIVIVARGRKGERELGVLDESFRPEALAWGYHGMGHGLIVDPGHGGLLIQVTVVPGATVISLGVKVLWSMLTDATGLVPALFVSSGRQGVETRAVNTTARFKARRTP